MKQLIKTAPICGNQSKILYLVQIVYNHEIFL